MAAPIEARAKGADGERIQILGLQCGRLDHSQISCGELPKTGNALWRLLFNKMKKLCDELFVYLLTGFAGVWIPRTPYDIFAKGEQRAKYGLLYRVRCICESRAVIKRGNRAWHLCEPPPIWPTRELKVKMSANVKGWDR